MENRMEEEFVWLGKASGARTKSADGKQEYQCGNGGSMGVEGK